MYAKVFTQIYDGTLCTKGPWEALVTFQQMLVLADMDGNVDMTAAAIARRTTIPLEIIERGLEELIKPDPDSRTPTAEGRRLLPLAEGRNWGWRIVNYAHYRELKREEDRREYHRQYWHKRKAANSTDSTETQHAQQNQPKQKQKQKQKQEAEAKEEKPARKRADSLPCPADVDSQVWADWLELRKAKRAPVSQTVLDGAVAEAEKAGMTLDTFLRAWCRRGSQGLEAAWLKPEERGQGATEPAWRTEKRQRTAEFLGLRPATKTGEVIDVSARSLD